MSYKHTKYFKNQKRFFKELAKQVRKDKDKIETVIARDIQKEALERTPYDTGALYESSDVIRYFDNTALVYNVPYASYQHEGQRRDGSRKIQNRPAGGETYFLRNAIVDRGAELFSEPMQFIENEIVKLAKKTNF